MGAFLSAVGTKAGISEYSEVLQSASCKRQRMSSVTNEDDPRLIPNLPDEISIQILARLPRIHYLNVKLVSRSWRNAITSTEIFDWRKDLRKTEEWLYVLTKVEEDKLVWHAFDPLSKKWQRLPLMPNVAKGEEPKKVLSGLADVIKTWLGRRDPLDRLPYCGCAIGAVNGCLYVLGGFSRAAAVKCVWRYDPVLNMWSEVESMSTGRAYCKTSVLNDKLYVVGGVSRGRGGLTPLQSAEVYDPCTGLWSQVPSMPFSKAQLLPTAFLADMLKPIATGMTSYRGRLCVPQSLYSWPFFVDVGGEVYDPETNAWVEMPSGMGDGWPARQAGTKLSVVVEEELYALDPSSSLDSCKIKIYNHQEDAWKVIVGKVPINDFTDSESPYLLASFLGRLHIITRDVDHELVVLQVDPYDRFGASSSASTSLVDPLQEQSDTVAEVETDIWKVIASRDFGSAELVSCQVLDI
ncbi:F-box/kelch-repeat protein [Thalictrum thalictroides]|uniref:F-box/kelch-repeat protein n=2 Tax=Thalictrum thalictroides TaxID=46969 RepID=A0A7J6VLW5_THATH|nr:F-box/kelch-repeat protein [Thalictrum thalictroides]